MTARAGAGVDRRSFLRLSLAAAGGLAAAQLLHQADVFRHAEGVAGAQATGGGGAGRYGPLRATPDANGLLLPEGFESRLIATGGERVAGTDYVWHPFPDGGATYPTRGGGWVYVSNSEVAYPGHGGAGAIRFGRNGRIKAAYRVLDGTTMNCSGGMTPWGSWLSGEEFQEGRVWECDVLGRRSAKVRPAMGVFWHEMAAADSVRQVVYMSEDQPDGLLYRFRPTTWGAWGALREGTLEAAAVDAGGNVTWVPVQDPEAVRGPARRSAPGSTSFAGGEGLAIDEEARNLYLTTKYDDHVYQIDLAASTITTIYEGQGVLTGVDNLVVHRGTGDLYVDEDGGDMQVVMIEPDGTVSPFLQLVGDPDAQSEITGIAFDPSGTRLYFCSQRASTDKDLGDLIEGLVDARGLGKTFEVTGPFVVPPGPTPTPTTGTTRAAGEKKS